MEIEYTPLLFWSCYLLMFAVCVCIDLVLSCVCLLRRSKHKHKHTYIVIFGQKFRFCAEFHRYYAFLFSSRRSKYGTVKQGCDQKSINVALAAEWQSLSDEQRQVQVLRVPCRESWLLISYSRFWIWPPKSGNSIRSSWRHTSRPSTTRSSWVSLSCLLPFALFLCIFLAP